MFVKFILLTWNAHRDCIEILRIPISVHCEAFNFWRKTLTFACRGKTHNRTGIVMLIKNKCIYVFLYQ